MQMQVQTVRYAGNEPHAAKLKQAESGQLEKREVRIKSWKESFSLEHLVQNVNACRNW